MVPSELSSTVALPLQRKRFPDSAKLMQGVHSHAAATMGTARGNVHRSRASSVADPARVKSFAHNVLKGLMVLFFPYEVTANTNWVPMNFLHIDKMPLEQLILNSATLWHRLTWKQFFHHILLLAQGLICS